MPRRALFALAGLCLATQANAADLTVTIDHLKDARGQIRVSLFNTPASWLDAKRMLSELSTPAQPGAVTVTFRNLQPGRYAVVTLDDNNSDGDMDYTFLGLPEKGFAFSLDVRPFLKSPSFNRAAIDVPAEGTAITIHMVYP